MLLPKSTSRSNKLLHENKREARREHVVNPCNTFNGKGGILHGQHRTLRTGIRLLHTFHFPHQAIPRHDGASPARPLQKRRTQRKRRKSGRRMQALKRHGATCASAERASIKYKQVEFLGERLGKVYQGTISGVTEWGIHIFTACPVRRGVFAKRNLDLFLDRGAVPARCKFRAGAFGCDSCLRGGFLAPFTRPRIFKEKRRG